MINRTRIIRKEKWKEKQLYGYFKRQTSEISHEKTWTRLRKGNVQREIESFPKVAQNNAIRTKYVKAKIDKMLQNSKCSLWGDRDEMTNYIISEYYKLAQKEYKTRHNWVGKIVYWELCKKLKFDYTSGICTIQNISWRMRRTNPSGILKYKQIT